MNVFVDFGGGKFVSIDVDTCRVQPGYHLLVHHRDDGEVDVTSIRRLCSDCKKVSMPKDGRQPSYILPGAPGKTCRFFSGCASNESFSLWEPKDAHTSIQHVYMAGAVMIGSAS